jgi:UDP-glucose 4-epimerase
MRCIVTGGGGFIGRHIVRRLLNDGHDVLIIDDLSNSERRFLDPRAEFWLGDILSAPKWLYGGSRAIFHTAAVSRTVPAVNDPTRCWEVNVVGSARMLEMARACRIERVIMSSSNVVYAGETAYKYSKLAMEDAGKVYNELYGQPSVISLRYSNVYGPGFRKGDVAVFASLRDSAERKGYVEITGDGEQSRDFTHVRDIVEANMLALKSEHQGVLDICTGVNTTLNEAAKYFKVPVKYVGDRLGDVKHIVQDPKPAYDVLGWAAKIALYEGIRDVWITD